jgi:hypothetical protein
MELDDAFHEREPESESTAGARKRPVALHERFKQPLEQLGLDPDARVADADLNRRTGPLQIKPHSATCGRKLRRVLKKVANDLRRRYRQEGRQPSDSRQAPAVGCNPSRRRLRD